jgi:nucleoside-diphosphate-sugar epimerase
MSKRILILGINGFIGHHLTERILAQTDWEVVGLDIRADRLQSHLSNPRLTFKQGSMMTEHAWIEAQIERCDTVLPLVAIATPSTYVSNPLAVFELDFEANMPIIRMVVKHNKRLIFPSTSEVYGMCGDAEFDPEHSNLVLGPINKPRWIYACSKQLLDRVIHAYGTQGLDYTLFRPFNWIGAGMDTIDNPTAGSARVISQFVGHIYRGEPIVLVDGGEQKRAFTDVADAMSGLMKVLENPNNIAAQKIYNIGNTANELSIAALADLMLSIAKTYPIFAEGAAKTQIITQHRDDYYGEGYQDVSRRMPKISNTVAELNWQPEVDMPTALNKIFATYAKQLTP